MTQIWYMYCDCRDIAHVHCIHVCVSVVCMCCVYMGGGGEFVCACVHTCVYRCICVHIIYKWSVFSCVHHILYCVFCDIRINSHISYLRYVHTYVRNTCTDNCLSWYVPSGLRMCML